MAGDVPVDFGVDLDRDDVPVDLGPVFDTALRPYLVLDPDLVVVAVNEAYLNAADRRRHDLVGRNLFDVFPGHRRVPEQVPAIRDSALGTDVETRTAVMVLDPEPTAVRAARTFVHDYCCRLEECGDICDTLTLLVSEVVTNAFLHGRSQARLRVSTTTTAVRVEVSDDNSTLPVLGSSDPEALGGRGLAMVDLLASAWGVREEEVGKTVWIELHAD